MRHVFLAACAVALLVASPARVFAQADHADSPKVTVTITSPMAVGQVILQPGQYKVQCRLFAGKTFLVVTGENGKEITRVPCVKDPLTEKVGDSQMRSIARADGTKELQSVRIKGETVAHRLVVN